MKICLFPLIRISKLKAGNRYEKGAHPRWDRFHGSESLMLPARSAAEVLKLNAPAASMAWPLNPKALKLYNPKNPPETLNPKP